MKKQIIRFFSLFMLVVLLVTAFSMQVSARVVFSDLDPTHWCYNKIIDFEKKGYVCGYQDGTFRADRTITRAEYVKIVNNFFGYKPNTENVAKFSDVSSDDWFAPYVNEAVARGYITGFEDGTFKPQDPIRRQEATVILARILGIDKEVYPADHVDGLAQYSDSEDVQEWARVAIHSYSVYNFINGYTDGTLKILQNVTRAETVELLHILEQKVIIDREPSGGKPTAKMPTIALWKQRIGETETGDKLVVSSAATPTKSGWINKSESTSRNGEDGVLVNITSTTAKSTINETLTGNKSNSRQYPSTSIGDLTKALFLTDGEYKISAFTSRTGYKSSKSAEKTILVDTKAPTIDGEVVTELPDGTIIAHEQKIKVTVKDPQATGVNKISGLDTEKVRYAWFMYIGDGIYERATNWANVILDSDGNAVISTEGLEYGSYKLGISAYDIAENPYGERIDKVSTISGDEELTEEIPYDFVEEVTKEGEEKPEDPDIIVIVGNSAPTAENLVMKTKANEAVSGKIIAEDKDGDTLTYTLLESGDYTNATISGDETSFKHENVGTYQYNVEVSDGEESAIALVTVYVYDVNVVIPSGDSGDPSENPEYDVTADGVIIYVGEEKELTAKVSPAEADNKEYTWAENAEEIDFVGETNSDKATIKGLVPGKTTVTVKVTVDGVEIEKDVNVIVKSKITVILPSYEKEYDGTKLVASNEFKQEDLKIDGTVKAGDVILVADVAGEALNVEDKAEVTKSGDFKVIDQNGNDRTEFYEPTFENGKLTIKAKSDEVVVTITEHSGDAKYDGTEHSLSGYDVAISNTLYTESDFIFNGTAEIKGTNAGSYDMELKVSDFKNTNSNFANVRFVIVDGTLEIAKREVELISASDSKKYDGAALTNDTVTATGDGFVNDEGATYTVTGSQIDVGESDNEFSYTLKSNTNADNYNITVEKGNLKVTPVTDEVTVTIKGNTEKVKYNGKKQEVTGYQVEISNPLYKESDFEFSGDARVEAVDADTYYMDLAVENFKNLSKNFTNVRFEVVDGSLVIEKRKVTLISATDEKEYDGTPLTNHNVTKSGDGFVNGEGASYNVTGSQTEIGNSDNKFSYTLNTNTKANNYEITTEEGKLRVKPVTTEVVVKIKENSGKVKYDGENHSVTGYTVESISNSKYTVDDFKFNGNATITGKDAGTYEMELKESDFENINKNFAKVRFEIIDGSLVIEKRKVTLTSAAAEKDYDGTPLTKNEVNVTGDGFADGEGATYKFTGSQTEVGKSDNKFTYTLNPNTKADNYEIKVEYGKLTVEEVIPDVKIIGFTPNYPDANGRHAEPGEKISYVLTIKNNEDYDATIKTDITSDGTVGNTYKVIYKDENGNVTKEETVNDVSKITIPANGTVEIIFESGVDKDQPVNSEFETTVTIATENDTELDNRTKNSEIQKSSTIVANNKKNKNIILIVDLSGSMDDDGKIAALRSAATTFTNKLKEDADTTGSDITLTLIGIGAGQGSDGTVTKYMYYKNILDKDVAYDDTYAYKMGFYTKDDWSKISEFINKNHKKWLPIVGTYTVYDNFYADGGTNITGALEIAHEIIEANNKYGARLLTDNAETFTVLLTDGANGPQGDIRISPTNVDATYVRENSTLFAIGFGDGAQEGTDGYNDLLAVTEDDDLIYSAASASDLNEAFESIANKIGQEQSVAGKIEIELPEDGKYFPIIVTHKVGGEETELFRVNTYAELASRKMSVNTTTNKLVWDLSGTDYSACEELKIKLTLDATATDGGADELLIDDIMNEVKDISIDIIENEKNPSGDVTENSGDEVKNTEEVISSGDNKNVDKVESGDDTKVIDSANNVEAKVDEKVSGDADRNSSKIDENVSGDADKNSSITDEKTSDANENESKVDEKVSEDANKNNVEADKNTENEVSNGASNNENEEQKNNEIIDGKQDEEVVKEEIEKVSENDEKIEAGNNEEQNRDEKEIVENKNDQQAIIPEKTTLKDEEENEAA